MKTENVSLNGPAALLFHEFRYQERIPHSKQTVLPRLETLHAHFKNEQQVQDRLNKEMLLFYKFYLFTTPIPAPSGKVIFAPS